MTTIKRHNRVHWRHHPIKWLKPQSPIKRRHDRINWRHDPIKWRHGPIKRRQHPITLRYDAITRRHGPINPIIIKWHFWTYSPFIRVCLNKLEHREMFKNSNNENSDKYIAFNEGERVLLISFFSLERFLVTCGYRSGAKLSQRSNLTLSCTA